MIHIIEPRDYERHRDRLVAMHRLRSRVFRDKLGWDVGVNGLGMEIDEYDLKHDPVYIIHETDGTVDGCCRLLPTTGPTLLAEVFADTLPDAAGLSSPTIWECTRLAVETPDIAGHLIATIGEVAIRSGIESIVGNFDAQVLRIYRRLGCEVDVLGSAIVGGRRVYLGLFPVSAEVLARVRERVGAGAERVMEGVS